MIRALIIIFFFLMFKTRIFLIYNKKRKSLLLFQNKVQSLVSFALPMFFKLSQACFSYTLLLLLFLSHCLLLFIYTLSQVLCVNSSCVKSYSVFTLTNVFLYCSVPFPKKKQVIFVLFGYCLFI